jgi:hypothetical protein
MDDPKLIDTSKEVQKVYEELIRRGARFVKGLRDDQKKRLTVDTEDPEDELNVSRESDVSVEYAAGLQIQVESDLDAVDSVTVIRNNQADMIDGLPVISVEVDQDIPQTASEPDEVIAVDSQIRNVSEQAVTSLDNDDRFFDFPISDVVEVNENGDIVRIDNQESITSRPTSTEDENIMAAMTSGASEAIAGGVSEAIKNDEKELLRTGDEDDFNVGNLEGIDNNKDMATIEVIKSNAADVPIAELEDTLNGAVPDKEEESIAPQTRSNPIDEQTPAAQSRNLLFKNTGKDAIDKLTKEDAKALSLMLQGKLGENVPDAANLKIMVDGKVVAQADAQGRLIVSNPSPALSKYFSALAKEEQRPSKLEGLEQVAKISENSDAPGHQFMQNLVGKMKVQDSEYMPSVTRQDGLIETDMASVDTVLNLYATKDNDEKNYQLKNGGVIKSRPGSDDRQGYQFFSVEDAQGNVDMGFTVCPDGQILVDPRISNKLQNEISLMQGAWDKGEYDDDTPLLTKDKVRAEAIQGFAKNIESGSNNSANSSMSIKTDKNNHLVVTSSNNPHTQMVIAQGIEGKSRILSNSLSTDDISEFNRAFGVQKTLKKTASDAPANRPKPEVAAKKKSYKSSRKHCNGQSM